MIFQKKPDNRLRLFDAMRLRSAYLPDPLPPTAAVELERAKRRCLACNAKTLCDQALTAGTFKGFALFCPNSHYIQHVRGGVLRFG